MDASILIRLALGAVGGFVVGLGYFGSLWLSVGWLLGGGAARVMVLNLARFAGLALGLFAIAHLGAAALVAAGVATLLARRVLVAKFGGEA